MRGGMEKGYRELDLIFFSTDLILKSNALSTLKSYAGLMVLNVQNMGRTFIFSRKTYVISMWKVQVSNLTHCWDIMHKARTLLLKWFLVIYWVSTDKRGLSVVSSF